MPCWTLKWIYGRRFRLGHKLRWRLRKALRFGEDGCEIGKLAVERLGCWHRHRFRFWRCIHCWGKIEIKIGFYYGDCMVSRIVRFHIEHTKIERFSQILDLYVLTFCEGGKVTKRNLQDRLWIHQL